jgi:rRNA-processing protein FCF1
VKVIADTSFLMLPGTLKIDILDETEKLLEDKCELVVPTPVFEELKRLTERGSPRERSAAGLALKMAERFERVEIKGEADESIVKLAEKMKVPVGTADLNLKRELRKRGIAVIYLRGESHLAVDGTVG